MEGEQIPKSKAKKHPPLPRLISKEAGHTCTPNSRTSLVHVGKRAFELAQEHSITNSRLTLGSALVLGGALGLTQVQSAKAVDYNVSGLNTFDLGITAVNAVNEPGKITFAPEITTVTSSGIEFLVPVTIDGTVTNGLNGGRVIITASEANNTCLI